MSNIIKTDPRVTRSINLIRDALIELIPQISYDKITVKEIASKAQINRSTFYLHFKDKDDMFQKIKEGILRDFIEYVAPQKSKYQENKIDMKTLTGINFRIFEHIQNNSELYKVIFVYNGIPNFYNELLEMIIRCIRGDIDLCNNNITGNFNDKDLIISYVSSSTMGVIKWWVQNDMPYTPNYMAKYIMKVTEEGAYKIFIQS